MIPALRDELWMVDLGMVQKPRLCLILSIASLDHERAVVSYVPRTTTLRGTRFEVPHQARGLEAGAFDAQGVGSVPAVKLLRRIGVVEAQTIREVETALKSWLALP